MGKSTTIDAFFKRKIIEDQKHKESDATPSSILSESLVVEPDSKPNGRVELSAFVLGGFNNWKKVNNGDNCAFLRHVGKSPNSFHRIAVKACNDLMNASQHIGTFIEKQSCAFRGRDESEKSLNRGNFHQLIKSLASYNDKVANVVQENAPSNASYTSHEIQKEILYIFSNKVRKEICQEIGNSKFCTIVDEAHDESKREHMALVLRYVDKEGCIRERFFGVIHVRDTMALTLKEGYDGAMRGEWNGLQALICHECPYAYYIHCLAYRLQLALVAASREVASVYQFFSNLVFIINIVTASSKRNDELKEAQTIEVATKIANGELEIGRGLNQIGTLK
ncbi:uncharacterized protein [Coffea arabica]|uniref:TTF-type domain-containing protein n=1 Tax=Coffea arabica TaxID=13443 RepID=A0ABM4U6E3_COFAR